MWVNFVPRRDNVPFGGAEVPQSFVVMEAEMTVHRDFPGHSGADEVVHVIASAAQLEFGFRSVNGSGVSRVAAELNAGVAVQPPVLDIKGAARIHEPVAADLSVGGA